MGAPIDVTRILTPVQRRFLRCFEACASVTQAARWAKISRRTHYDWLDESEVYTTAFVASEKVANRSLEDEAVRRAHQGVRKAVRYKGKVVGYDTEYSDGLMLALLKGGNPDKYRERGTVEVNTALPPATTEIIQIIMVAMESAPPEHKAALAAKLLELEPVREPGA